MDKSKKSTQDLAEASAGAELAGKYLTFSLASEEFGVEILKVREIIGLMDITIVPRTPRAIRGVINLRGKIIPVVDLRAKFEMPVTEDTELTCIIVVDVQLGDLRTQMGILVDAVSEVLDIPADQIEPTPAFGAGVNTQFIRGMARCDDKVKILLNIEQVLEKSDAAEAHGAQAGSGQRQSEQEIETEIAA